MANSTVIRVLLVDDHAIVREGLKSLLQTYPDLEVIGEAANGQEAVELAALMHPSVIVMDINMPKMTGIEATARIKAQAPHLRILGLSVNSKEFEKAILRAGAEAIISKEEAVDRLYGKILEAVNPQNDTR
jgi:DNA-binding NarL/FixJ family response regulator